MIVVMVFVTMSAILLSAAYDGMHQLFVFEESSDRLPSTSDGIEEALGHGLARLQTGEPTVAPNNKYTCDLKLRDSNGDLIEFRLTYKKLANNEWWLEAKNPTGASQPTCPPFFSDNTCPAAL